MMKPRTRAISDRPSAVTHHFEKVTVGIEKVNAVVIAPIDRCGALDSCRRKALERAGEIGRLHLERMMPAAERMRDYRLSCGVVERRTWHLEQRKVLAAAIEQYLIAKSVDDLKAEDAGVETLGARQVSHLDPEMIQPLEFHR